ncbi:unnamed protein product [Ceutorhynchus assimilis]|uniref:Sulfatase N-terminal domain-containing protein n=1 Tax=Ceutorhynchus assimilis TaxID=467358 RepID=A0A9N9QN53_9CUCU|nr:unnamed protein product [Ceutorhynchus assimilis]
MPNHLKPTITLIVILLTIKLSNCDTHPYKKQKPNIILFLTDDQDVELGSLNFMPKTLKNIRENGLEFRHAYVTTPMCCPSRSSLLTGMYVHNHEVFTNKDNCSSSQWQATHETKSFATYLSNAGYRTGYFGKYLNKYNGTYIPPGWREWGGLIMNSKYYNYSVNMNGQNIKHGFEYDKDYYTDVIAKDAMNFIRNSKKQFPNKPIMLVMAFPAPHGPEDSAPQFSDLYFNVTTHHTPSYNFAPNPDKQWILQVTGQMQPLHKDFTNMLMTKRLQTLQSVDKAVEDVINELDSLEELENSFVVYTSDHGYHLGQFGLVKGKSFPFEFDVRVPFLVRGPGIERGGTKNEIVLNIDLAPTFLDIAGIKAPTQMDGRSILPAIFGNGKRKLKWPDTFLIESSGRRETPHLQTKQYENNLLQYSVPKDLLEKWNFTQRSGISNDLLIQLYKNLNPLEAIQKKIFVDENRNNDVHGKLNGSGFVNIKQKFAEFNQGVSTRVGRETFRCFFDTKLPCRNGQKWFCQMHNGKWHKYKCKEETKLAENEDKQCICFTADGPVFKPYWMKTKRSGLLRHKNEYKYCYCDNENDEISHDLSDYEPSTEEKIKLKKQRKKEEVCHHERMTCFEHNNDHWRTSPKWTEGPFCFCMNANNNTYSCLRTINLTHNFLYCEFTTGLVTFYNLRIDPFELQNRYQHLTATEKTYLRNLLKNMVSCKGGASCTGHLDTSFRLNGLDEIKI